VKRDDEAIQGIVRQSAVSSIALDCFAPLAMTPKPLVVIWRDRYFSGR
jgi:hypothetical protein